jgi:excisionase family DNA binding protein
MLSTLGPIHDVEDAAIFLKAHPVTIRRWVREGRLKARRSGQRLVFTDQDLSDFLQPAEYAQARDK